MSNDNDPPNNRVKFGDRLGGPNGRFIVFTVLTNRDRDGEIYQVDYSPHDGDYVPHKVGSPQDDIYRGDWKRLGRPNTVLGDLSKVNMDQALLQQRRKLEIEMGILERKVKIILPPGHRLNSLASMLLDKKNYKRYIYPHVADMHVEYFQALKDGDERKARFVVIMFYLRVLAPVVRAIFTSIKTWFEFTSK